MRKDKYKKEVGRIEQKKDKKKKNNEINKSKSK